MDGQPDTAKGKGRRLLVPICLTALLFMAAAVLLLLKASGSGDEAENVSPPEYAPPAAEMEATPPPRAEKPDDPVYDEILGALQSASHPDRDRPSNGPAPSGKADSPADAASELTLPSDHGPAPQSGETARDLGNAGTEPIREDADPAEDTGVTADDPETGRDAPDVEPPAGKKAEEETAGKETGRSEKEKTSGDASSGKAADGERKQEEASGRNAGAETDTRETPPADSGERKENVPRGTGAGETSDWVQASRMPDGAEIVNEKWTYTLTETAVSAEAELPGWVCSGSGWVESGSGTLSRCEDVSSFNPSHWVCAAVGASEEDMAGYETETAKRVTSGRTFGGYVYYHWMYACEDEAGPLVPARWRGGNSEGRSCTRFFAFLGGDYPAASLNGETVYLVSDRSSNAESGGSYYWFRQAYETCSYTDYVKEYRFTRTTEDLESETEVRPGNGISHVIHYVQYR